MNWQLISFFGDSSVLQHSARFSAGLQKAAVATGLHQRRSGATSD
ncbi:hypothetical protein ABEL93_23445 [Escherichia coli]